MKKWKMKKWNFKTKYYEEYTVPADWKVKTLINDMEEEVNCAICGKSVIYGHAYPSRTIHDENGFGYAVCYACRIQERDEELVYEN